MSARTRSPPATEEGHGRGRSKGRAGAATPHSPSSPIPLSPQRGPGDEYGNDEGKRLRSRQRSASTRRNERGSSRRRDESPDGGYARHRSRSQAREWTKADRGEHARKSSMDMKVPPVQAMLDRARLKDLAARELEERRNSLARREPFAPPIASPHDLTAGKSPQSERAPAGGDSPTSWRASIAEAGVIRSKTTSPDGSHVPIGLPATPRAMRHPKHMGFEAPDFVPAVPDIPSRLNTAGAAPSPSEYQAPASVDVDALPNSIYASPHHPQPSGRSLSAPISEETSVPAHPAYQAGVVPSTRRRGTPTGGGHRKGTPGDAASVSPVYDSRHPSPAYLRNPEPVLISIDETIEAGNGQDEKKIDKAGLPTPPLLPELQHLAIPPPPPPAPAPPAGMAFRQRHSHSSSTSSISGVINIGIEGESNGNVSVNDEGSTTKVVNVEPVPRPNRSGQGHTRTRSGAETTARGRGTADSISQTINRVTQRMRSKSGSRNREKSPQLDVYRPGGLSPYESLSPPVPVQGPTAARSQTTSPLKERHPREVRAEMIAAGSVEGGLI